MTQEKYRVDPGPKQAECTARSQPSSTPTRLSRPAPRARARSALARPCRPRLLPSAPAACAPQLSACAPSRTPNACLRAQPRPAPAQPLLYRGLVGHYIAIQSSLALAPKSQYNFCIAIQIPSCQPSFSIAIQTLSCNTISPLATLHSLTTLFQPCNTKISFLTIQSGQ